MREKLNNNPMAQLAVVAVLVVVAGFMLLTMMGGGGEEEAESNTSTSSATVETPEGSASITATATTPAATEGGVSAPTSVAGVAPVPSPQLPDPVREAIVANRTVVILIVKPGGIDDRRVDEAVQALAARPQVATFVVPVDQVPRYTAVTQPVNLERTPALIVVRPPKLSHGSPAASVNYGFQSIQSVVQAVVDAAYKGRELEYHP
jgi:hypothetical protein